MSRLSRGFPRVTLLTRINVAALVEPRDQARIPWPVVFAKAYALVEDPDIAADPDLWRDTLDGESDAIDLIRNLIRASIDADLLTEATRKRQAEIAARADRAERRKQAFRAAAFALMDLAGIARLPEPDFVARIQPGQPQLADLDLDALPPDYVEVEVTVTRRPFRDRLLADLKAGQTIPGASLLRGLPFLVVHRK